MQADDFPRYSDAMQAAAEKGLVWTPENLDAYIADPMGFFIDFLGERKRHGMFFKLDDAQKRKQVIAFLEAIKDDPACP